MILKGTFWCTLTRGYSCTRPIFYTVYKSTAKTELKRSMVAGMIDSQSRTLLKDWFTKLPTCFPICGKNVDVLYEPSQMYQLIIERLKSAKERIVISSLYLGNGEMESKMVSQLKSSLDSKPTLKAHVLLDFTRGSRGERDSRSMLMPCIASHPSRMTLSLFHTPNLRGLLKAMLPDRFNELLGLQHMKVYVFDDTVILSGANLSHDYFTNRQDRYIVINNSREVSDYFCNLIHTVSLFSYQTDQHNQVKLHHHCLGDPTHDSQVSNFIKHAKKTLRTFITNNTNNLLVQTHEKTDGDKPDTWICPLLQMGSFDINDDHNAFSKLIVSGSKNDTICLATAYFNPLEEYAYLITEKSRSQYDILAASPQVNGFYNASGVAGYIPNAYSWYEKAFVSYVDKKLQGDRIRLHEYVRDGWTFHAKGLWYYPNNSSLPSMTIIGSSNFGYRSVHRDLEAQVAIATENKELQMKLHTEKENIYTRSVLMTSVSFSLLDRYLPAWTGLVASICRHFF